MEKIPSGTLSYIAHRHGLELREKTGTDSVFRATIKEALSGRDSRPNLEYQDGKDGQSVIVKYGKKINPDEVGLMQAAANASNLSFQVPRLLYVSKPGEPLYYIAEFIDQRPLVEISKVYPRTAGMYLGGNAEMVRILQETAKSYQDLLKTYAPTTNVSAVLAARGMARFMAAIAVWEAKMLKTTPASARAITQIMLDLANNYRKYGAEYMGYAHGDIHARHVLPPDLSVLSEHDRSMIKPYLLDLNAQVKPGKGFYDMVRALDSTVAHSHTPSQLGDSLFAAVSNLKNTFDPQLLMPVVRARMLAIGTDIQASPPEDILMRGARNRLRTTLIEATH